MERLCGLNMIKIHYKKLSKFKKGSYSKNIQKMTLRHCDQSVHLLKVK